MGHLQPIDLLAMALYAVLMVCIGRYFSRRQRDADDYFVAGRNASSVIVGISMIATLFSTISFLGTPGELITYGPGLAWGILHAPLTYLIVATWIIPHIMRRRVTSGYELLESSFGDSIRKAASLLFVLVRLQWVASVMFLCSGAVAVVTQLPLPLVLACVGAVTVLYTVMGGIRAVLVTDVIQFTIHFGSGLLIIGYVAVQCQGQFIWPVAAQPALSDLAWQHIKFFSLSPFDRVTIVGAILSATFWWVCTATSDQMMIQRYLCTGNVRAARRSFLHCLIGEFGIALVLWGIALALLAYFVRFPERGLEAGGSVAHQADRLFPHFIATVLPTGIRGVVVAALFADAMQSLSSGISALGTVLVVDFKSIFARGIASRPDGDADKGQDNTDPALAGRAKIVGLLVGIVAIALSYVIGYVPGRNFFDIMYRLGGLFTVPLFVIFAMAFFVPRSTPAGAWAAIFVGFFSGLLFSYWKQIVGAFSPTSEFSVILIMPLSLVVSLAAGMAVSTVTAARRHNVTQEVLN